MVVEINKPGEDNATPFRLFESRTDFEEFKQKFNDRIRPKMEDWDRKRYNSLIAARNYYLD